VKIAGAALEDDDVTIHVHQASASARRSRIQPSCAG
jgi:hypothetical protein